MPVSNKRNNTLGSPRQAAPLGKARGGMWIDSDGNGTFDGETRTFRRNVNARRAANAKGYASRRKNRLRG